MLNYNFSPLRSSLLLSLALIALLHVNLHSQETSRAKAALHEEVADGSVEELPNWIGKWVGDCKIQNESGEQRIEMEFIVERTTDAKQLKWQMTFKKNDSAAPVVKNYRLANVKGKWLLDEGNGVEIPATKIGDGIYLRYSVGEIDMSSRFELSDDVIEYQMIVSESSPVRNETATAVASYRVKALQTASLLKSTESNNDE